MRINCGWSTHIHTSLFVEESRLDTGFSHEAANLLRGWLALWLLLLRWLLPWRNYVFHGEVGCAGEGRHGWHQLGTTDKRATKNVANTCLRRTCFSQSIISEVLSTLVASYHSIGRFRVDNRRALSRKLSRWESRRPKSTSEGRLSQHPSLSYALGRMRRFRKNFPWRSGRMWPVRDLYLGLWLFRRPMHHWLLTCRRQACVYEC